MKNTINQSKLWVYTTAFLMSFNGGYVNAVCLTSFLKNAVGYVTGDLTFAGYYFSKNIYHLFFHLIFLVICFLFGSIISGLIIKGQNLSRDHRYNVSLVLQFLLILVSMLLLFFHQTIAGCFLAITMGMQNAMTTHYGSALIRTTHMTGTATDLGILIARGIKGDSIEGWKIILYLALIIGFLFGAIMGAIMYYRVYVFALIASLLIYVFMLLFRS